MSSKEILQRPLDARGLTISHLGAPSLPGDATFTDNTTTPSNAAGAGNPGKSLLAAPADHVHPAQSPPVRVAASGTTTIAANARVTLATVSRQPGEMFTPGGYVFVRDDVAGVTWENEVNGADHIATYHERTSVPNEFVFRGHNASDASRTIDWTTVALRVR